MNDEEFLAHVLESGAVASREEARRWSMAVLGALTHLLSDAETRRRFITQLPGSLKSHLLAEEPRSFLMDREAFLQHVGAALKTHVPEAERAVAAVYPVVRKAVSAGEIAAFEAHLPKEVVASLRRLE
jgi:uncharacterized protein (DUF2267 family)